MDGKYEGEWNEDRIIIFEWTIHLSAYEVY